LSTFLVDFLPPNHARTHTEENVVSLRVDWLERRRKKRRRTHTRAGSS
jgi:hypothetical protein